LIKYVYLFTAGGNMPLISSIYYHGTKGDAVADIMKSGYIRPNSDGQIFFSRYNWESCLMHGADRVRKASFVMKVQIEAPDEVGRIFSETAGVRDTVILRTFDPIPAKVVDLYVRKMSATRDEPAKLEIIKGSQAIARYLAATL
jgi:hypothetical protein